LDGVQAVGESQQPLIVTQHETYAAGLRTRAGVARRLEP